MCVAPIYSGPPFRRRRETRPAHLRDRRRAAGVAPDRCVFIDDRPENVAAARSLGMTGIHFRGIDDLAVLGAEA
ncbi:HAD-IA family hydrolase [Nocardia salmonicida]